MHWRLYRPVLEYEMNTLFSLRSIDFCNSRAKRELAILRVALYARANDMGMHCRRLAWRAPMKSIGLAVLLFVGVSFSATPASAATLFSLGTPGPIMAVAGQSWNLVALASQKSKHLAERKKRKRSGDYFNFSYQELGIIPGHVPTPYGYRDCIGRWHLHDNGIIHCHGQLLRDD
jgi:hypothetical protein